MTKSVKFFFLSLPSDWLSPHFLRVFSQLFVRPMWGKNWIKSRDRQKSVPASFLSSLRTQCPGK